MLAAQVADQRVGVVGLVFVHRGASAGADDRDGEKRIAENDGRDHQRGGVGECFVFLPEDSQQQEASRQEEHHEDCGADIELGPEAIDEEPVKACGQLGQIRNDAEKHDGQDNPGKRQDAKGAPERDRFLMFLVIDQEHDGRDGQQVEQVDADGEAHQEADEDQPTVGVRLVGLLLPFEACPEDDGGEER